MGRTRIVNWCHWIQGTGDLQLYMALVFQVKMTEQLSEPIVHDVFLRRVVDVQMSCPAYQGDRALLSEQDCVWGGSHRSPQRPGRA